MTRRERLERKAEKRREWAAGRAVKSDASFESARRVADGIPLGQPILVGHHSEKHARRDQDRIRGGMSKGVEHQQMAEHHRGKAAGIEQQLRRTIFSDDPDAIESLEAKVVKEEADVARKKAINTAFRKAKGVAGWGDALGLSRALQVELAARVGEYSWITAPYERYEFANARNRIRQARERIKSVRARACALESAEAAGGVEIVSSGYGDPYVRVTFAEKPEREILNALRVAGFHWSGSSWRGLAERLPESVRARVPAK